MSIVGAAPKRFVLIGETGNGKSTLGNCLINERGDKKFVEDTPFNTSSDVQACTRNFTMAKSDKYMVLDTIGFRDANMDEKFVIDNFKKALRFIENKVDGVLLVRKRGRFDQQTVEFFKWVHQKVLDGQCGNNSMLIVTGAPPGWIMQNMDDPNLRKILEYCNHKYYEFNLRMDREDDTYEDTLSNKIKRDKSIAGLVRFIESQELKTIRLKLKIIASDAELQLHKDLHAFLKYRSEKFSSLARNLYDHYSTSSTLFDLSKRAFAELFAHFDREDNDMLYEMFDAYLKNEKFESEYMLWLKGSMQYYKNVAPILGNLLG